MICSATAGESGAKDTYQRNLSEELPKSNAAVAGYPTGIKIVR
jgi:hypothetical protein